MSGQLLRYQSAEWPHGLRCIECDHLFSEGQPYSERLDSIADPVPGLTGPDPVPITEIVCVPCGMGLT
jgi:hypothetical protein